VHQARAPEQWRDGHERIGQEQIDLIVPLWTRDGVQPVQGRRQTLLPFGSQVGQDCLDAL